MSKILSLLLVASLGAGSAAAQQGVTVYGSTRPTATVSFADLDIGSKPGLDRLRSRVRNAAGDLCFEQNREPLEMSLARSHCYDVAIADGFAQVDRLAAARMAGNTSLVTAIIIAGR